MQRQFFIRVNNDGGILKMRKKRAGVTKKNH